MYLVGLQSRIDLEMKSISDLDIALLVEQISVYNLSEESGLKAI